MTAIHSVCVYKLPGKPERNPSATFFAPGPKEPRFTVEELFPQSNRRLARRSRMTHSTHSWETSSFSNSSQRRCWRQSFIVHENSIRRREKLFYVISCTCFIYLCPLLFAVSSFEKENDVLAIHDRTEKNETILIFLLNRIFVTRFANVIREPWHIWQRNSIRWPNFPLTDFRNEYHNVYGIVPR